MTRPCLFKKTTPGLLGSLIAIISAQSFPTQAASTDIEEIIVTASKREQSLQDYAGSISVVTKFDGVDSLSDIASQVPGLSLLETGPRNPTGIIIRGLRMDAVDENDFGGDGASVASYVDNIPLQGYFVPPAFSLKDLQQVEVLRGPQGTLYGNASIGGLIRYITAKPDLNITSVKLGAAISQTKESNGVNYDTDLVINAPLADTLGVRLLLGQTENQGFIDNPYLLSGSAGDINDDKTQVARVGLRWKPEEKFSLASSYHYQKINVGDRQATNEDFTGDKYTASSRYRQPMEGELHLASVDADYQFDWAALTASINRYDYETATQSDQTDFFLTYDERYMDNTYYSTYEDFSAYSNGSVKVGKDSAELRLISPDEQPLRWLVGGFYSRDDLDVLYIEVTPGFGEFAGEDRPDDMDYFSTQVEVLKENSVYGELAYDITDAWDIMLGGRHFRYKDDLGLCMLFFPLPDGQTEYPVPTDCMENHDTHTGTLGKFGTQYRFSEQQQIYFTVSEGYRRGGANVLPIEIEYNLFYKPDTAINYELGTKANWFEHQLNMDFALFYIDWSDTQINGLVEGYPATLNARKAISQGVEVAINNQLSESWLLSAHYSFTDAELTENVAAITGGDENAYKGDRLPGSPRHQLSLGVDYKHVLSFATLDAGIHASYNSDVYTALNDEFIEYDRLDGFTTTNLNVGVSLRNWRLGGFVNNITNTRGITGKRTSDWYREQGKFEYVTRPRTVGVSVSYQY